MKFTFFVLHKNSIKKSDIEHEKIITVKDYGFGKVSSYELEYLNKPIYENKLLLTTFLSILFLLLIIL